MFPPLLFPPWPKLLITYTPIWGLSQNRQNVEDKAQHRSSQVSHNQNPVQNGRPRTMYRTKKADIRSYLWLGSSVNLHLPGSGLSTWLKWLSPATAFAVQASSRSPRPASAAWSCSAWHCPPAPASHGSAAKWHRTPAGRVPPGPCRSWLFLRKEPMDKPPDFGMCLCSLLVCFFFLIFVFFLAGGGGGGQGLGFQGNPK